MPSKASESRYKLPQEDSIGQKTFERDCRAYGLVPEQEYIFHPTRKWRFDFAWPSFLIAVEIEGGGEKGRHQRRNGFEGDAFKYNAAALLGWRVFRFTTPMVKSGAAIDTVREALTSPLL